MADINTLIRKDPGDQQIMVLMEFTRNIEVSVPESFTRETVIIHELVNVFHRLKNIDFFVCKIRIYNYASRHHTNASLNSVSSRSSLVWLDICIPNVASGVFLDTSVDGRPY